MAQRDPFYAVKDKVTQALQGLRSSVTRAEEVVRNGGDSSEVDPLLQAARGDMGQIHIDVKDLAQTITIVEENRSRFPSIDNRELDSRRTFVTDAKTSLAQFDEQMKRLQQKAAAAANKRKQLLAASSGASSSRFQSSANEEASRANDDFIASSRQSAMQLERQQDEVMDDMSHALDRLAGIGQSINAELVESEHQLSRLDEEIDMAQGTMQVVLKKMDKLLKSSDKGRLCCIVLLFVLAVALFFAIIYG